jgi:hypothetical protein
MPLASFCALSSVLQAKLCEQCLFACAVKQHTNCDFDARVAEDLRGRSRHEASAEQ